MSDDLVEAVEPEEKAYFEQRGEVESEKAEPEKVAAEQTDSKKPDPSKEEFNPDKHTDLRALQEERHKRQDLQEQLITVKEQVTGLQGIRQELDQHRKATQAKEEGDAYEDDPMGYLKNKVDKVTETQQVQQQSNEQQLKAQQDWQAFSGKVTSLRESFTQQQPDYPDAYKYMMDARLEEFEVLGMEDPSMRQQQFDTEALALANYAIENNQNPAELLYRLAEHKGYAVKKDTPTDTLEDKVKQLDEGQKAAATLADTSSNPESGLSLTNIEKMSDEEFDKLFSEYERDAKGA